MTTSHPPTLMIILSTAYIISVFVPLLPKHIHFFHILMCSSPVFIYEALVLKSDYKKVK
jgi:hypothetical protein